MTDDFENSRNRGNSQKRRKHSTLRFFYQKAPGVLLRVKDVRHDELRKGFTVLADGLVRTIKEVFPRSNYELDITLT